MASFIILLRWNNCFAIITRQFTIMNLRTKSHAVIFTPEALQSYREKLIYKYNKMINIAIAPQNIVCSLHYAPDAGEISTQ
ncbi:hypothetical protein [Mesorhizobium sp. M0965]|uniref:hypothetical protein n=1 Tax=Mesorhizobium sp. M0965 TaxID=2957036 RepID=UPI003338AF89